MKNFRTLQRWHEKLLEQQQTGADISEQVKAYIDDVKVSSSEIYQNAQRDQLRSNLRYWASYLYEKTRQFPQLELKPLSTNAISTQKRTNLLRFGVGVVGFVIVVCLFSSLFFENRWNGIIQTPTVPPTTTFSIYKYGFDKDKDPMGWVARDEDGNIAVKNVQQQIKFGQGSLELQIELIGKNAQKSKGEAFVNLLSNPPSGVAAPLDLEGKPITMLVYIPSSAIGYPNSPNGIQIFVVDTGDRSQYGVWWNLTSNNTETWTRVTLEPSLKTSPEENLGGASTNEGFDPSKIKIVGLKIGTGSAFDGAFVGSIWIDWVSWP